MNHENSTALATAPVREVAAPAIDMTPEVFKARIEREGEMRAVLKDYVRKNMIEGHHYSKSLGTVTLAKPMLLQEGTRNICSLFKLHFGEPQVAETWLDGDHYRVRTHIGLFNQEGTQIASGDAICSTRETKYAYRKGDRTCPECNRTDTIIKGKSQYGGGWVCYEKKGGCSAKFDDDDERITSQQLGRVDNPDKADVENTVLKMSIKRAKTAAVCDVPMVSEIFAPEDEGEDESKKPKVKSQSKPDAGVRAPEPAAGAIETAVNLATKLQKDHDVKADDLAAQFLPDGVTKFSELSDEQAAAVVPGLAELLTAKVNSR